MNIEPIIFFDMMAAVIILALVFVVVILHLLRITKAVHTDPNLKKDEAFQSDSSLLDEARIKAVKIVDDANNKALDIISSATLSTNVASDKFKEDLLLTSSTQIKEFEKATSDFTKIYAQTLRDLKTKNIEVFQNVSKNIELNTMEEIKNFKDSMQSLTTLSQKEVKEKIDSDYEAARKQLEEYQKENLEKIDSGIYALLEKISKLVLGKALSLSDHEDLIQKAIEKAKKEGGFK